MINGDGRNGGNGMERAIAARQTQIGGDWFFWIAGLSVVNALLRLSHSQFGFFFGLGLPDFILVNGLGQTIYLGVTLIAAGVFALCGFFARRGARWAFLAGMALYVLDALVCLPIQEYLEGAVHAYALFRIFQGFQAAQRFAVLSAQQAAYAPGASSSDVWPPPPSV